mgnify:FL=1
MDGGQYSIIQSPQQRLRILQESIDSLGSFLSAFQALAADERVPGSLACPVHCVACD